MGFPEDGWPERGKPSERNERPAFTAFGARVRAVRKARCLSQGEVAARAGFSQQHMTGFERGYYLPSMGSLEKLAMALNVAPSDLLEGKAFGGRDTLADLDAALEDLEQAMGKVRSVVGVLRALAREPAP